MKKIEFAPNTIRRILGYLNRGYTIARIAMEFGYSNSTIVKVRDGDYDPSILEVKSEQSEEGYFSWLDYPDGVY